MAVNPVDVPLGHCWGSVSFVWFTCRSPGAVISINKKSLYLFSNRTCVVGEDRWRLQGLCRGRRRRWTGTGSAWWLHSPTTMGERHRPDPTARTDISPRTLTSCLLVNKYSTSWILFLYNIVVEERLTATSKMFYYGLDHFSSKRLKSISLESPFVRWNRKQTACFYFVSIYFCSAVT